MPKPATELPNNQVKPDPTLEKRTRRKFTAEYKLRIITQADACQHGELGALLRRENLYSNQPGQSLYGISRKNNWLSYSLLVMSVKFALYL